MSTVKKNNELGGWTPTTVGSSSIVGRRNTLVTRGPSGKYKILIYRSILFNCQVS
jgi:hypothetical protein